MASIGLPLLASGSLMCISLATLPGFIKLGLACATVASLCHTWQMQVTRTHPAAVINFYLIGNNRWLCTTRNGQQFWAELDASSCVLPQLMSLNWRQLTRRKTHQLIIWPDSLPPKLAHRLRVYIAQLRCD